jgi:hypothetical protein
MAQMTESQRESFFHHWWPDACRTQGWDRNDRAFRLQKIGEIIGRPITSMCDTDNTRDWDKLIPELRRLEKPNSFKAALDTVDASQKGEARRHIALIEPLIAELDGHFGPSYVDTILRRRFKIPREGWYDLKPEKLRQLLSTVNARCQMYRREKVEVTQ